MGVVNNVKIYGLKESIKASKYPMATDIDLLADEITDTVASLGHSPTGSGHDNFLNGIIVQFDLTLTIKAWTEAERYHFLDFVSSQSTVHKITKFDLDKQCHEYVTEKAKENAREMLAEYNANPSRENYQRLLYNIPTGFKLTARMTTNYRQLKTIRSQRKMHTLEEWREVCRWINTLPKFIELVGEA